MLTVTLYGVSLLIALVIGLQLGFRLRDMNDKIMELQKRKPEPRVGASNPYRRINEWEATQHTPDTKAGIVLPKTPAMLEWEQQERIKQDSLAWTMKPTKDSK